jgi:methionyl-tRNA formyltransferase
MGTPEYALPALKALANSDRVEVPLVVTQPDRPQGRGRKLQSPPVKVAADAVGLETLQVSTLRGEATRQRLEHAAPDLVVVAAFGIILGPRTLNLPRLGCVNLHASLLPKYRGANPIAAAIAMGEDTTGITLMQMDRGLDTGPILATRQISIGGQDTTATLTDRLAVLGAELLIDHLEALRTGTLVPMDQPPGASLTRPMTKDDGWIEWNNPSRMIDCHVRAMIPWPRAWTTLPDGTRLQVLNVKPDESNQIEDGPGIVLIRNRVVSVCTGDGSVRITTAQLPGGRAIEGHALTDKLSSWNGSVLGKSDGPGELAPLVIQM